MLGHRSAILIPNPPKASPLFGLVRGQHQVVGLVIRLLPARNLFDQCEQAFKQGFPIYICDVESGAFSQTLIHQVGYVGSHPPRSPLFQGVLVVDEAVQSSREIGNLFHFGLGFGAENDSQGGLLD